MGKRTMKAGTMLAPVPAVMVSCADGEKKNILTIAWTGVINSDPPIVYISVRKSRFSHDMIEKSGEFVINLVTEDLARAADFCGVRSGAVVDKFKECHLTAAPAEQVGAPLIAESPVNLECKVMDVREFPTHDMFVAEVVKVHADEALFDENGKLCLERAGLVAYSHGEYFALRHRALGRFGFAVMKPKTKKRVNREMNAKKRAARMEEALAGREKRAGRSADAEQSRRTEKGPRAARAEAQKNARRRPGRQQGGKHDIKDK